MRISKLSKDNWYYYNNNKVMFAGVDRQPPQFLFQFLFLQPAIGKKLHHWHRLTAEEVLTNIYEDRPQFITTIKDL